MIRRSRTYAGLRKGFNCAADMITRLNKLVSVPGPITVGQFIDELAYVTLKAFEDDQPSRKLRVYERQLSDVFGKLADLPRCTEMIGRLRQGCEVDLPRLYSARLLTELGFCKCQGE